MVYQISNDLVQLSISEIGAEMKSIKKDGAEYLWDGNEEFWPEQAPLLFPYVGRFTDGKYTLNGKTYEMGIHGFARKLPYRVVLEENSRIRFQLKDTEETYCSYPYHFVLEVEYALEGDTIGITYHVKNETDEVMYFGIGGHPGFRVPLEEGLDFSDYYLEFSGESRPERVGHTPACFLSGINQEYPLRDGRCIDLRHTLFDEDAIVLQNVSDEVTLKSDRGHRQVKVSYPNLPYLGLWHAPKTEAPYICIEPWTSLPSRQDVVEEFRYKSDLIRLAPHGEYVNNWKITIQ